jgi:SAM-dependent methyltransferase
MTLFSTLRQRLGRRAPGPFYRSCNFCGGTSFRVFRRLPQAGFPPRIHADRPLGDPTIGQRLSLQYLECLGCGLIAINPLPRFADIDRTSFDGERNVVAWVDVDWNEYESSKRDVIRIVEKQYAFEGYRRTNRLLDVSCGPGVSLAWLRDAKAWQVDGTDPDRHSVRLAQERYGLTIHNGLIHQLRAATGTYDLVLMDNSLEHTFDPLATLLEAYRVLRPGGAMFVFVPNSDGLSTIHLGDNVHWGHWFLYSPLALVQMLERVGFSVVRLIAIQNPINPRLAEAGIDAEAQLDDLRVDLNGVDAVRRGVASRRMVSDYFNLLAVKPDGASARSPIDPELRAIANASRVECAAVRIVAS